MGGGGLAEKRRHRVAEMAGIIPGVESCKCFGILVEAAMGVGWQFQFLWHCSFPK
jgi:hypothetical protein